jgi:hypothetical protein
VPAVVPVQLPSDEPFIVYQLVPLQNCATPPEYRIVPAVVPAQEPSEVPFVETHEVPLQNWRSPLTYWVAPAVLHATAHAEWAVKAKTAKTRLRSSALSIWLPVSMGHLGVKSVEE